MAHVVIVTLFRHCLSLKGIKACHNQVPERIMAWNANQGGPAPGSHSELLFSSLPRKVGAVVHRHAARRYLLPGFNFCARKVPLAGFKANRPYLLVTRSNSQSTGSINTCQYDMVHLLSHC